ncbi:MAG: hypothetical protein R3B84_00670 [Zavarzinella sp.]
MLTDIDTSVGSSTSTTLYGSSEVVELSLLIPRWQLLEIEAEARKRGTTVAQVLRKFIYRGISQTEAGN